MAFLISFVSSEGMVVAGRPSAIVAGARIPLPTLVFRLLFDPLANSAKCRCCSGQPGAAFRVTVDTVAMLDFLARRVGALRALDEPDQERLRALREGHVG
jgi:hypothetical protein